VIVVVPDTVVIETLLTRRKSCAKVGVVISPPVFLWYWRGSCAVRTQPNDNTSTHSKFILNMRLSPRAY